MKKKEREQFDQLYEVASAALTELRDLIGGQKETLQETYDNRSEKWQEGEKGEAMQAQIERLESFEDELSTAVDALEQFSPDEEG